MRAGSPEDSGPESRVVGISSGRRRFTPRTRWSRRHRHLHRSVARASSSARVLRSNESTLRTCPGAGSRLRVTPMISASGPSPITIALAAVAHARTPGCSRLERAVDLYHSTDYMVPRPAAHAGGGDGLRRHPDRSSAMGEPAIAQLQELAANAKRPQCGSRDRDFGGGKGRDRFELRNPRRTNPRDPARNRRRMA